MWGPITKNVKRRALGMMQIRVGNAEANISLTSPVLTSLNSLGALAKTSYAGAKEFHDFKSGFPEAIDGKVPLSESAAIDCDFKELTPFNMAIAHGINPFADVVPTVSELSKKTLAGTTTGNITVDEDGGVVNDTFIVAFTGAAAGRIFGAVSGQVHVFTGLSSVMAPVDGEGNELFNIPVSFFSGTWADGDSFVFRTTSFVAGTNAYSNDSQGMISLGVAKAPDVLRVEAILTFPNETNKMIIILPRAQAISSVAIDAGNDDIAVPVSFVGGNANSEVTGGHVAWNSMPLGVILFV